MTTVWVIDDDDSMRWVLDQALGQAGFSVRGFADAESALVRLADDLPDAVITDIRMPGIDGLDFAARLRRGAPAVPVIIITAHSDLDTTVAAFDEGAYEYLPKPFDLDEAVDVVRRACRPAAPERDPGEAAATAEQGLIGRAPAMQPVFRAIGRLAHAPVPVLITGESGTGKELIAHALHHHSPRSEGPFVALNMAAIPHDLLESELFGHERGAFTGADQQRAGRFEQAAGGTLFLDEIGDMPPALQTRLLRILSEGVFHRLGGREPLRADVRILAATHQDLEALVARGAFRADLYHRLNVVRIEVPPLRARREDIPALAHHFLRRCARELGVPAKRLTGAAGARLARHDWPGNVRELENVCRWLTVMAPSREIEPAELPDGISDDLGSAAGDGGDGDWLTGLRGWADAQIAAGTTDLGREARRLVETELLRSALTATAGHRQHAARLLGWGRNTLTRRLRELGMESGERNATDD